MLGRTSAPALRWKLNGTPLASSAIRTVRPLESARTPPMLEGDPERTFSGIFDLPFPQAGNTAQKAWVEVRLDGGNPITAQLRTMPREVPEGLDTSFNVLLTSCFHWEEDKHGIVGTLVDDIRKVYQPDLVLAAGDQVYLDLPTLRNFPEDLPRLAEKFEQDYIRNWTEESAYARVLAAGPLACIPDDHDYWNNYPLRTPHLQNTWGEQGRDTWGRAARRLCEAFQHYGSKPFGEPSQFDVEPLSFFIADTRSFRTSDFSRTMTEGTLHALAAWVTHCADKKRIGIFSTGQSLLMEKPSTFGRTMIDAELPNYEDYGVLLKQLERLMREAGDLLLLTGDVHWGRVSSLASAEALFSGQRAYEVISSPSSLVTTLGSDQLARMRQHFTRERWPRHPEARKAPALFAPPGMRSRFQVDTNHLQPGNQVCLLSFQRRGRDVEVTPRYFPLEPGAAPVTVKSFLLSHRT
ncbi:metallophosphatase [Archangium sp.]|uniref:metallophosphatase n=1 Tax=Archangium sp. TaxID=1872627 RepID=UPI002D43B6B1|nr:metallophosphatase [Archangium sp.]HYO51605.1 metallophosphatase [Archangium sp.]